jgi:hypothetical protein
LAPKRRSASSASTRARESVVIAVSEPEKKAEKAAG